MGSFLFRETKSKELAHYNNRSTQTIYITYYLCCQPKVAFLWHIMVLSERNNNWSTNPETFEQLVNDRLINRRKQNICTQFYWSIATDLMAFPTRYSLANITTANQKRTTSFACQTNQQPVVVARSLYYSQHFNQYANRSRCSDGHFAGRNISQQQFGNRRRRKRRRRRQQYQQQR